VTPFSWNALDVEMKLDVQRIWKRNMGRDDRCISDHGKKVRLNGRLVHKKEEGEVILFVYHFQFKILLVF
jgi:hypothetical protein